MAASLPPLGGGIVFESSLPVADAPQINDSLDNILVIDNIPQVTQDKFDKLKAVILKVRKSERRRFDREGFFGLWPHCGALHCAR